MLASVMGRRGQPWGAMAKWHLSPRRTGYIGQYVRGRGGIASGDGS
ncbi:MAG TPA: hypothetical protein V6D02_05640 [Candidatus Obscuribacterales bacterium]